MALRHLNDIEGELHFGVCRGVVEYVTLSPNFFFRWGNIIGTMRLVATGCP